MTDPRPSEVLAATQEGAPTGAGVCRVEGDPLSVQTKPTTDALYLGESDSPSASVSVVLEAKSLKFIFQCNVVFLFCFVAVDPC